MVVLRSFIHVLYVLYIISAAVCVILTVNGREEELCIIASRVLNSVPCNVRLVKVVHSVSDCPALYKH